jgi:hypothetical protein
MKVLLAPANVVKFDGEMLSFTTTPVAVRLIGETPHSVLVAVTVNVQV